MRVAIVCANYKEGKSYQENVWAEQLAKSGHDVRVFHAALADGPVKRVQNAIGPYESQAAKAWKLPKYTYVSPRVHLFVREFRPELIVLCGDKTFAVRIARDASIRSVPMISTYSENLTMHEFDWRKRGISMRQRSLALGFAWYRGGPIRLICRRSALVVGNTPQARGILKRLFRTSEWPAIDAKMIDMPLGFSPDHFGYDPAVRRRVRAELGVNEREVLVCASSHFTHVKEPGVKLVIDALREVMKRHESLKAVIVGFSNAPEHAAVTARIAEHIDAGPFSERFIKHPFAGRERLCELYNGSDIAFFARASISCQETLGTGLIGCLVDDGSLKHLITMPGQGVFFKPGDERDLVAKLEEAQRPLDHLQGPEREKFRRELADGSRWLGYDRIIDATLRELQRREGTQPALRQAQSA